MILNKKECNDMKKNANSFAAKTSLSDNNKIVAALDIGSDKVICAIGSIDSSGHIFVNSIGEKRSVGISCGAITDMISAKAVITQAIETAERLVGCSINKIVLNISGKHVKSSLVRVEERINGKRIKEVHMLKISKMLQEGFRKRQSETIHLIPIEYKINTGYKNQALDSLSGGKHESGFDDGLEVNNPNGMSGDRLSVRFHAALCSSIVTKNIKLCLSKIPMPISKYIVESYASATACLTNEEKIVGTLLMDIGHDSTSIALMKDSRFYYSLTIQIAGKNISDRISQVSNVDIEIANKIKITTLNFLASEADLSAPIYITSRDIKYDTARICKKIVNEVAKSVIGELIHVTRQHLIDKDMMKYVKKIVVTGGSASINGIDAYIEKLTEISSRKGMPSGFCGKPEIVEQASDPKFSCIVGMLILTRNLARNNGLSDFSKRNSGKTFIIITKILKCLNPLRVINLFVLLISKYRLYKNAWQTGNYSVQNKKLPVKHDNILKNKKHLKKTG